jgi:hypothetical protein
MTALLVRVMAVHRYGWQILWSTIFLKGTTHLDVINSLILASGVNLTHLSWRIPNPSHRVIAIGGFFVAKLRVDIKAYLYGALDSY